MSNEVPAELVAQIEEAAPEFPIPSRLVPDAIEAFGYFCDAIGLSDFYAVRMSKIDHLTPASSDAAHAWIEESFIELKRWLREHGVPKLVVRYISQLDDCETYWELSGTDSKRP